MPSSSTIEFNSVSYTYPNGVSALEDINLTLRLGEIIALVGENGAGKTTLIKHINGLLKPTRGTVYVFGLDSRKSSVAHLSRRVGIVFQNPHHQLFADTVENEIRFALKNFGFTDDVIEKRIEWALEFFGLKEYRKASPLLLSGGEKKRLTIATVLAWKPDVIVLDEPTVGQDFNQKEKLQQIIRLLMGQGNTIVIISHDIEFLWPLQPRTVVMAKGKILADDSAANIFTNDDILQKANLVKPQLLEFWLRLKVRPESPFSSVYETVQWVRENHFKVRSR